ncbi:hypothetical protein BDZ45DRAFT_738922 [Acephala macrosclerotiorum]|nr:hypothetical protein BDZ45DRAFT_738922 [Acephala macrosclerotiorum]
MIYTAMGSRHHPRSKNGCLTCKERHVRCGEKNPFCRNCLHLGREFSNAASIGRVDSTTSVQLLWYLIRKRQICTCLLGAFIHYQETKSVESKEVYLTHSCVTFKLIQQEIEWLSPGSVDALLAVSIVLAFSAESWEQKQVFVNGYSKAPSYIQTQNITAYPDLLTQRFHFRDFITRPTTPTILSTRSKAYSRVLSTLTTITTTKSILGSTNWHELGFASLKQVAHSYIIPAFLCGVMSRPCGRLIGGFNNYIPNILLFIEARKYHIVRVCHSWPSNSFYGYPATPPQYARTLPWHQIAESPAIPHPANLGLHPYAQGAA